MLYSPTFTVFYHKIQANVVKYTSPTDPNYGIMEVENDYHVSRNFTLETSHFSL